MHSGIWPTVPGAILGYRKNGTPVRLIAGGSGESDGDGSVGQDGGTTGCEGGGAGGDQPSNSGASGDGGGSAGGDDQTAKVIAAVRDNYAPGRRTARPCWTARLRARRRHPRAPVSGPRASRLTCGGPGPSRLPGRHKSLPGRKSGHQRTRRPAALI